MEGSTALPDAPTNTANSAPTPPVAIAPVMPATVTLPSIVQRTKLGPSPAEGEPLLTSEEGAPAAPVVDPSVKPAAGVDPNAPRAAPLVTPRKININTASKAELELLPGIGPALAERIIEARTRTRMAGLDDLDKVRGIGPKLLEKIGPRVVFEDGPSPRRK